MNNKPNSSSIPKGFTAWKAPISRPGATAAQQSQSTATEQSSLARAFNLTIQNQKYSLAQEQNLSRVESVAAGVTEMAANMEAPTKGTVIVSNSQNAVTAKPQQRKGKKSKWQKVDLNAIAPDAGPLSTDSGRLRHSMDSNPGNRGGRQFRGGRGGMARGGTGISATELVKSMGGLSLKSGTRDPLTEFARFGELPAELRFKIWRFAGRSSPRILELVHGKDIHFDGIRHWCYRVSPKSIKVPAIMHVNHESRREGSRIYEKRSLHTIWKSDMYAWFNPEQDYVYFGENACMYVLHDFFLYPENKDIARIAIICSGKLINCCDMESDEMDGFGPDMEIVDGRAATSIRAVIGGATPMKVLHGVPKEIAGNGFLPGAPGVKEVCFVVKTELMQLRGGDVHADVTFRPAIHDGLTNGQMRHKRSLEDEISLVHAGNGVSGCGENRWADGSEPEFHFVSFAPPLKDGRGLELKHDAVMVPTKDVGKITWYKSFIRDLSQRTGCDIEVSVKQYIGQSNIEIGIYNGTEKNIEEVKRAIAAQLEVEIDFSARRGRNGGQGQSRGGEGSGQNTGGRGGGRSRGGRGGRN